MIEKDFNNKIKLQENPKHQISQLILDLVRHKTVYNETDTESRLLMYEIILFASKAASNYKTREEINEISHSGFPFHPHQRITGNIEL